MPALLRRLRDERALAAVVVVGVVLRVAWAVHAARAPVGLHDPGLYRLLAAQLANLRGYQYLGDEVTAYYPPGYAFSLTPLAWLVERGPFPDGWWTGGIAALNVLWQTIAMIATAAVARRVSGVHAAGPIAAGVLALWPNLVVHAAVPLTESLFLAVWTVALALAVRAPWREGWETRRIIVVGALLGAATLVRPITVPVFPVLLVALLASHIGWRRSMVAAAQVGVVALAVLAPWVVRNVVVMDALTLSTNTGDNLCMSRFVGATGGFQFVGNPCFDGRFDHLRRPEYETEIDAHGRSVALEFVREHPGEEASLWLRRLGATFRNDSDGIGAVESYGDDVFLDDDVRERVRDVSDLYGWAALAVAVPGAAVLLRRGPGGILVVASAIAMLLPVVLFFGDPRFKIPVVPSAAVAIASLAVYRSANRRT